jgi:hypothetical protein
MRNEQTANLALAETAARTAPTVGAHFATRGPVRTYRKPSLIVRILRAFA